MGTLYVVGTPIGNLADFSQRGKQTLAEVDLIACEDTRRTAKLLSHFDIHTPTESYHGDSSEKKRERIVNRLKQGDDVALVSDAGTPAVSDPGMRLVQAARKAGVEVAAVPGPSAITTALSIAGVRAHTFTFFGYVPRKQGRESFFQRLADLDHTAVFFASVHRVERTLADLTDVLTADRKVVVCRELTKQFESTVSGTPQEVQNYFDTHQNEIKGEFVVVVSDTNT